MIMEMRITNLLMAVCRPFIISDGDWNARNNTLAFTVWRNANLSGNICVLYHFSENNKNNYRFKANHFTVQNGIRKILINNSTKIAVV